MTDTYKGKANRFSTPLIFLFLLFCLILPCQAEENPFATTPIKNSGAKWRIGYYEGGDYSEYHTTMDAAIKGLMALGWIEEAELPDLKQATGKSLWSYYVSRLTSDYLTFVPNGFYSAGWHKTRREETKIRVLARMNKTKDLDLVIAMGTWAGIDLSQGNHQTPTIVMATSDAVASGITKSHNNSGNIFIHARVDPNRFERQIRIFHTVIGFQTLGMVYRDNIEGRSYAAVNKVKKVARERGFTIKKCFLAESAELKDDEKRLIQCVKNLLQSVDAIYVTENKAVNETTVPMIAAITKATQIPTFSQAGHGEVKKGLLLSISRAGFKYVGNFYAETMANIFNGAMPGELNQIFEDPSKIVINLSTAESIGFFPSLDVLSSADVIYRDKNDEK